MGLFDWILNFNKPSSQVKRTVKSLVSDAQGQLRVLDQKIAIRGETINKATAELSKLKEEHSKLSKYIDTLQKVDGK